MAEYFTCKWDYFINLGELQKDCFSIVNMETTKLDIGELFTPSNFYLACMDCSHYIGFFRVSRLGWTSRIFYFSTGAASSFQIVGKNLFVQKRIFCWTLEINVWFDNAGWGFPRIKCKVKLHFKEKKTPAISFF